MQERSLFHAIAVYSPFVLLSHEMHPGHGSCVCAAGCQAYTSQGPKRLWEDD
jgi:hypothetical protein